MAEILVEEMRLKNVQFKFTGGVDGGRGLESDIRNMLVEITKMQSKG